MKAIGGIYAVLLKLFMVDGTTQAKVSKFSWAHLRQIIREGVSKSKATPRKCNRESGELSGHIANGSAPWVWKVWSPE